MIGKVWKNVLLAVLEGRRDEGEELNCWAENLDGAGGRTERTPSAGLERKNRRSFSNSENARHSA